MVKYSVGQADAAKAEGKSRYKTELYMMAPEFSTEPQQDQEALSSQPGDERVFQEQLRMISTAPGSTSNLKCQKATSTPLLLRGRGG